ncbi:MAG: hypothetical protein WCI06_08380 [Methylococcaceae bacterium]
MKINILILLALLVSTNSVAHSGRTNINGCHLDRSTNIEHCHGSDNETMTRIIEPAIKQNKMDSENKLENETVPSHSNEKPSKVLLATYISLFIVTIFVVIVIFAFDDLLKSTVEFFNDLIASILSLLKSIFD